MRKIIFAFNAPPLIAEERSPAGYDILSWRPIYFKALFHVLAGI